MTFSIVIPTFNRLSSLKRTLDSVFHQTFNPGEYEVIVVDDGSSDGTAEYLTALASARRIHYLRQEHKGPACARNAGIRAARGTYIAFTDDDCVVPPQWLQELLMVFEKEGASLIGGAVVNKVKRSFFAEVGQFIISFLEDAINITPGQARFLTSNNIACRRVEPVAEELFDERFKSAGAEDRELCERLIHSGKKVVFEPTIQVEHYHQLTLGGFLRQQRNYGQGSYLLYRTLSERGYYPEFLSVFHIYFGMIQAALRRRSIWRGIAMVWGVMLSQLGVLWGYYTAVAEERTISSRKVQPFEATGFANTVEHLVPLIVGGMFSVLIGAINLILVTHALSASAFGILSSALSLHLILTRIAGLGLGTSIVRFSADALQANDIHTARTIFRTGFGIQITLLGLFSSTLILFAPQISSLLTSSQIPASIMQLLSLGITGMAMMEFISTLYSAHIQFRRTALLQVISSGIRLLGLIVLILLVERAVLDEIFLVYMGCYWIACAVGFPLFRSSIIKSKPEATFKENLFSRNIARQLLSYGGWVTTSAILGTLSQNIGNVLLINLSTSEQTGIYGLSLFTSFFINILAGNVLSYLMPYASRLESHEGIEPFFKSTLHVTVPIILGSVTLLVPALVIFPFIFGATGRSALPVFLILSCAQLIGLLYRPLHAVFHYLLKPYLIVIEMLVRIGAIIGISLLLVPTLGAIGMALANLAAMMLAGIASLVMLWIEQRESSPR